MFNVAVCFSTADLSDLAKQAKKKLQDVSKPGVFGKMAPCGHRDKSDLPCVCFLLCFLLLIFLSMKERMSVCMCLCSCVCVCVCACWGEGWEVDCS